MLHKGALVAEGRIEDLLSSAVTGFRIRCAAPAAALAVVVASLPEGKARLDGDGTVHVAGDASILPRLHRALLDAGHPVVEMYPVRASLEAYFLDLTEGVMG